MVYLGHIVSAEGVTANPSKIQAVVDWPAPHSVTAMHRLSGLMGYYRNFKQNYASITTPLTAVLWCNAF